MCYHHTCVVSNQKHLQHAQNSTSKVQQNVSNAPSDGTLATEVHQSLYYSTKYYTQAESTANANMYNTCLMHMHTVHK